MKRTFGAPVPYDAASYIEELEAEVDRLTDTLALVDDDRMFRAEQLQRALPVIKAARAVNAGSNEWSALRDALAEYDR